MYHLNLQHVGDNPIDHPPLEPEPRGAMTLPLTRKSFVVKSLYGSQTLRPGKLGNVFPFLVTLQNLNGNRVRKLFVDTSVLRFATYHIVYIPRMVCQALRREMTHNIVSSQTEAHSAVYAALNRPTRADPIDPCLLRVFQFCGDHYTICNAIAITVSPTSGPYTTGHNTRVVIFKFSESVFVSSVDHI